MYIISTTPVPDSRPSPLKLSLVLNSPKPKCAHLFFSHTLFFLLFLLMNSGVEAVTMVLGNPLTLNITVGRMTV
jgi:hypothetical protein